MFVREMTVVYRKNHDGGKTGTRGFHAVRALRFVVAVSVLVLIVGSALPVNHAFALSPTHITFPLSTNMVWYGSTYQGHGSAYDTLRSAMDITYTGGSAEGYTVYAMATGSVISRDDSNGQIVVKVSTPLVTTNGAYIGSWFYCYAHMKNISVAAGSTVTAGQSVGQVSMVGNATGPHLHINIVSADYGGSIWSNPGTKYAISPYYVYGFVDASGNDVSYFQRDKSGPAVTEWLINHVPVSTAAVPDSSAPAVNSAEIQNITTTGFDVVCRVTDNIGVTKVTLAVWNGGATSSDQDDLQWYTLTTPTSGSVTDGTWKFHIDIANHNNDYASPYNVDIRGYDAAGNVTNPYKHIDGIRIKQPITSISFDEGHMTVLARGESRKFTVTTEPADYDQSKLIWSSSNDAFVSVSSDGVVTAHHIPEDQNVIIKCESMDGTVYDVVQVDVYSNLNSNSTFFVDRVPANFDDAGMYGLVALIRETGDMLECNVGLSFSTDAQSCDVEYVVEEGNLVLNNGTLFIGKNTSRKNVVAAYVYDQYEDGTRGPVLGLSRITVFMENAGGTFTLPSNLSLLEENAFDGVAARNFIIPASLTELPDNSLAGIPVGSRIFFNSDTIHPFYDCDVLGLPDEESRTEDYEWIDTGSMTYAYYDGDGGTANYYYLADQVEYSWTDWSTTPPAEGVECQSKTQYRSRDVSTESSYSDWSGWVSNGTTAIEGNDLREVKTVAHAAQTKTVYTYDHYKYYHTTNKAWYYSYADTSGNSWSSQGKWEYAQSDTPYTQYKWASSDGYDGWRDSAQTPWFHQATKQVTTAAAYTEYQYRTRTIITNTAYGEWSEWQDYAIDEADNLEVETRVVYRAKVYY